MNTREKAQAAIVVVLFLSVPAYFLLPKMFGRIERVKETPVCKSDGQAANPFINLREDRKVGERTLVFPFAKCLLPGLSVRVSALNLDAEDRRPHWWTNLSREPLILGLDAEVPGEAIVTEIFSLTGDDLKKPDAELASRLSASGPDFINGVKRYIEIRGLQPPVILVQVKITKQAIWKRDRMGPKFLFQANTPVYVEGTEGIPPKTPRLTTFLKQGGMIYDVRSPEEYARWHFKGSLNVPYFEKRIADPADMFSFIPFHEEDDFDLEKLPPDKTALIAFSGAGPQDVRPVKAQLIAKLAGWRRATVIWGGARALKLEPIATPVDPRFVVISNAADTEQRLREGNAILIDVREPGELAARTIKGSWFLPRDGKSGEWVKALSSDEELSDSYFKTFDGKGLLSSLVSDKNKTLIFFGSDQFDWRPLNFARFAMTQGYGRVLWMRDGLAGWLTHEAENPERFATVGGAKSPPRAQPDAAKGG